LTEQTWATVQQEHEVSVALRTDYTPAAQFATRSAVRAANLAFEIAAVSSALAGNAIQRCWRDVNAWTLADFVVRVTAKLPAARRGRGSFARRAGGTQWVRSSISCSFRLPTEPTV
jgi:hypothetical protein